MLLPTGITPVTAIPTFVKSGNKAYLWIEFNGAKEPLEILYELRNFPEFLPAMFWRPKIVVSTR